MVLLQVAHRCVAFHAVANINKENKHMSPQILQSLISLNRNTIHDLHHFAREYKASAKYMREVGEDHYSDKFYKDYIKTSRSIKQLVRAQKALKKELAETIECERRLRNFDISAIACGQYE
jgi:hypothetical protein